MLFIFFQAEAGIRDGHVTGVQTCALPISTSSSPSRPRRGHRHGTPPPPTPSGATPEPNGSRAPAPAQRSLESAVGGRGRRSGPPLRAQAEGGLDQPPPACPTLGGDRKSTRLNSSHVATSYAVFCLTK